VSGQLPQATAMFSIDEKDLPSPNPRSIRSRLLHAKALVNRVTPIQCPTLSRNVSLLSPWRPTFCQDRNLSCVPGIRYFQMRHCREYPADLLHENPFNFSVTIESTGNWEFAPSSQSPRDAAEGFVRSVAFPSGPDEPHFAPKQLEIRCILLHLLFYCQVSIAFPHARGRATALCRFGNKHSPVTGG
jgi:hypothetical protein